jgi:hypothetical protein
MAGLDTVALVARDAATLEAVAGRAEAAGVLVDQTGGGLALRDPWGTRIALTQ